ncbi:MAG: DUF1629 domain-containing protein [Pseudomonadota bacterium]
MTDEKQSDGPIWCIDFMMPGKKAKLIKYDLPAENDNDTRRKAADANREGEVLRPEYVPYRLYWEHKRMKPKRPALPDLFWIYNRSVIVTARFKSLLEQFNIGRTRFFQVPLFDDGIEVIDETLFVLNLAEVRDVAVPEKSTAAREGSFGRWFISDIKSGAVVVKPNPMDGLDLVYQPKFSSAVFISDRLDKAMKAAKIRGATRAKCKFDTA